MLPWTQLIELCCSMNFCVLQEKLSVAKLCVLNWQNNQVPARQEAYKYSSSPNWFKEPTHVLSQS